MFFATSNMFIEQIIIPQKTELSSFYGRTCEHAAYGSNDVLDINRSYKDLIPRTMNERFLKKNKVLLNSKYFATLADVSIEKIW